MAKKEFTPIHGQFPDREKIQCRNCMFRKKVLVTIDDQTMDIGAGKSFCDIFPGPPEDNGKPVPIMFNQQTCPYKIKEK